MADTGGYTFTFDFVDATQTIALGTVLPFACLVVVFLRILLRRCQHNGVKLDDWFILFGLLNVIGMGASLVVGAALHGMGYPTPKTPANATDQDIETFDPPSMVVVGKMLMILAYGSIKFSITLFYRRVFVTHRNSIFDILSKVTLIILGLWTLTFELIMMFDCGIHFRVNWGDLLEQSEYCSVLAFSSEYGMAVSDLILDLIVILMPIPLVWKLRLTTEKKLAVTGILLLGASAVGASVARLVLYLQILAALTDGVVFDNDLQVTVSMYWSLLEAGLALIAACLPTLSLAGKGQAMRSALDRVTGRVSSSASTEEEPTYQERKEQTHRKPSASDLEMKKYMGGLNLTEITIESVHIDESDQASDHR